jgi:hypothetical protein
MGILVQTTCLMFLLGMVFSWPFPLILERRIPTTYVHTSFEEGPISSSSSLFDNMNRMIASMHQRFEHMFGWPTFPTDYYDNDYDLTDYDEDKLNVADYLFDNEKKLYIVDDLTDIRKKLDTIEPICTTITDSPTTISPRKSRRKKLPTIQTTTCIKELIINGQKHFSEEINTTDDKGVVIKHSKSYGAISVDTNQIQQ